MDLSCVILLFDVILKLFYLILINFMCVVSNERSFSVLLTFYCMLYKTLMVDLEAELYVDLQ